METITVRFFAALRERTGCGSVEMQIEEAATAADVARMVVAAYPSLAPYANSWRLALNRTYVDPTAQVKPGDEVALITPVSGG